MGTVYPLYSIKSLIRDFLLYQARKHINRNITLGQSCLSLMYQIYYPPNTAVKSFDFQILSFKKKGVNF